MDTRCYLFVGSAYAPIDWNLDEVKYEFYRRLSEILQKTKHPDIALVVGDFNIQLGLVNQTETHLSGYFSIMVRRTQYL